MSGYPCDITNLDKILQGQYKFYRKGIDYDLTYSFGFVGTWILVKIIKKLI